MRPARRSCTTPSRSHERLRRPRPASPSGQPAVAAARTRPYARPTHRRRRSSSHERSTSPARITSTGFIEPPGHSPALARTPRISSRDLRACFARASCNDDLGYPPADAAQHLLEQLRSERSRLRPALARRARSRRRPARAPAAGRPRGRRAPCGGRLPGEFRDSPVAVDITGLLTRRQHRALRIREGTVMSRLYRARQRSCAGSKAAHAD
jgi:hypothetical protein